VYVGILTAAHSFGHDVMTIYLPAARANRTMHDHILFVDQADVKQS